MDGGSQKKGSPKMWVQGWVGVPKYGETQKKGGGMGSQKKGNPKMWEKGWMGDPKIWEQGWMGVPK